MPSLCCLFRAIHAFEKHRNRFWPPEEWSYINFQVLIFSHFSVEEFCSVSLFNSWQECYAAIAATVLLLKPLKWGHKGRRICVITKFFSIFTRFLSMISGEKSAHFCSGNFAWCAQGHPGNFDVRYLTCSPQCISSSSALKLTC
jgi:hypothetical protein